MSHTERSSSSGSPGNESSATTYHDSNGDSPEIPGASPAPSSSDDNEEPASVAEICDHFNVITTPSWVRQHYSYYGSTPAVLLSPLKPIKRRSDGQVHPRFPLNLMIYRVLDETVLDDLAKFYGFWDHKELRALHTVQAAEDRSDAPSTPTAEPAGPYARLPTRAWTAPTYTTPLGAIHALSSLRLKPSSALPHMHEFNETMLTAGERCRAKRQAFGYFIGVEHGEESAPVRARRVRWEEEMLALLVRVQQVVPGFWVRWAGGKVGEGIGSEVEWDAE